MEAQLSTNIHWSENVIIVDADYIDRVAFNLIVNFERMIGRRIQKADMPKWIDCVALDGGMREGKNEIQVVLLHNNGNKSLENFAPNDYENDLNGKAFSDNLGEFVVSSFPVEKLTTKRDFLVDIVKTVCSQQNVKRVMIVPDADEAETYDEVRSALHYVDDDKRVTVFAMQPMAGGNFRQEILGYSLMSALGIKADEIK
jgi:hypothetical protein